MARVPILRDMKGRVFLAAATVALLVPVATPAQTFSRFSKITVYGSNSSRALPGGGVFFREIESSAEVTNGTSQTYSTSLEYTGDDRDFNERTMFFEGEGSARGDFGVLRTRYAGTVENTFYNEENPPMVDSTNGGFFDPQGVPDILNGEAQAGWVDELVFGGFTANGYTATYVFDVHGENASANGTDFSWIDIQVGSGTLERTYFQYDGSTQQTVRTAPVFIGNDGQVARVTMTSWFQVATTNFSDGTNVSGFSDFARTAVFRGVEVRDPQGRLVSDVTITSASGTQYQVVPEPATLVTLALGAVAAMRRFRKKA